MGGLPKRQYFTMTFPINRFFQIIALALLCCNFVSCVTTSTSTGIITTPRQQSLPPGVPSRVGVILFKGDLDITLQATEQFLNGLPALGFQVVERSQINAVLKELGFQQSDSVDSTTRERLGKLLGLEGVFVGSITGESSATWIDSHLNVRLVSIETGKVVWAAEAHDPRLFTLSTDVRTSAIYTVREALKLLRKDLLDLK